VYASRIQLVRKHAQENIVRSYEDSGLPPEFKGWFEASFADDRPGELPAVPAGLLDLFEGTAAELEAVLRAADPAQPVWTWWEADQTAGFWQRRMAHETAVHRWDAQLARGDPQPIESELAADGLDENFDVMLPERRRWAKSARQGAGEVYHFHRTDGPGEWAVRFAPDGPVVTREHVKGDVAVRGPASDLLLVVWQRIPADRLDVFGDAALLERYFELVPPD
jgi:uncharacterized protein (TIGR03083 family)